MPPNGVIMHQMPSNNMYRFVPGRLEGKVAIVTGGGSGIGAAGARRLAAEGAAVVVADLNGPGAEQVASEIRAGKGTASAYAIDLHDTPRIADLVDATIKLFGGLDILFNNAVAVPAGDRSVGEMDLSAWETALRVNLTAPMYASKLAIPNMRQRGGGSIVHMGSVAGMLAEDTRSAYGATKSGLFALSRSIAVQYGKDGIRSNVIAPGLILTPAAQSTFEPETLNMILEHHMTPRLGASEDVAGALAFLCSEDAAFITGHVLNVDGGFSVATSLTASLRRLKDRL